VTRLPDAAHSNSKTAPDSATNSTSSLPVPVNLEAKSVCAGSNREGCHLAIRELADERVVDDDDIFAITIAPRLTHTGDSNTCAAHTAIMPETSS
jgi:hypothetical protein